MRLHDDYYTTSAWICQIPLYWCTSGHFYWHGLTGLSTWICNHNHSFLWDMITHSNHNFTATYIKHRWSQGLSGQLHPGACMDVATYPCHKRYTDADNFCFLNVPMCKCRVEMQKHTSPHFAGNVWHIRRSGRFIDASCYWYGWYM